MNNVSVVPIIFIALDFVWFLSPLIVLLLILMVIKSLYKLPKYPDDRRRHFYPLQAYILVFSGLLILCNLLVLILGHISPAPLFNIPPIYIQLFSLFSFFIVIGEIIFQRRLPLTKNDIVDLLADKLSIGNHRSWLSMATSDELNNLIHEFAVALELLRRAIEERLQVHQ